MGIFFSSFEFFQGFTPAERALLRAAAQTDEQVAADFLSDNMPCLFLRVA